MEQLDRNLWVFRYDLSLGVIPIGRVVTVLRLQTGALVIHSTAPYGAEDLAAIRALGEPRWLAEATNFHDTFSEEGRRSFPGGTYLVPEGFPAKAGAGAQPLSPAPPEWAGEIEVLPLRGVPLANEHVMLHRPSRTLIVADLVFNWAAEPGWRAWLRSLLTGVGGRPDMSRMYRRMIRDREAFTTSLREMMRWDFDRLIPAHGEIIARSGKEQLRAAMQRAGYEC
ncbi:MAG: hypothetical protein ACO1QR_10230 [Chthoniobacteraceae bacterium]